MLSARDRRDKVFLQDAADLLFQECHAAVDCAAEGGEGDDAGRDEGEIAGPVKARRGRQRSACPGRRSRRRGAGSRVCRRSPWSCVRNFRMCLRKMTHAAAPELSPVGEATVRGVVMESGWVAVLDCALMMSSGSRIRVRESSVPKKGATSKERDFVEGGGRPCWRRFLGVEAAGRVKRLEVGSGDGSCEARTRCGLGTDTQKRPKSCEYLRDEESALL